MIYDISTPLSSSTPVYPGDPPVRIDRLSDAASGDEFTLSRISMSLGTKLVLVVRDQALTLVVHRFVVRRVMAVARCDNVSRQSLVLSSM